MGRWPPYLKNSPTYPIDIYDIFDKAVREEFESEVKTGSKSSFVRRFDEKPSKTAENRRKSVRVPWIWGPSNSGASAKLPARRSDSEYAEYA